MALRTATNPQTGERLAFVNGQWVPFTRSATNPDTGEKAVFVSGRWITESTKAPEDEEESGFFRQTLDVPVKFTQGVATGIRLISDAFGADNPVSQNIRGVENWLQDLLSAQAKEDQREISRIMEEAKDAGVADQVVAALKAFGTAPIDFISQAAGTALPTVVGGLASAALRAPAVVGLAGTGAAMGAGTVKSSIYAATYETLREAGASDEEAKEKAVLAQEYGGENLDQILIGTVLGGVAGRFGVEPAVAKQIAGDIAKRSIAKTALKEAGTEAAQAGQEQVAQNIALQRQGFDVPTARGVAGAATLEALAGAGLGASVEALRGRGEGISPDLTREDVAPPPPAPPVTPSPPAGEVAPPPTAPQVDEGVPEWLRQELDSVESTSQAAKAIVDMESELGNIAETLGTPEILANIAKQRKTDIPVLEERLRGAAEELQTRLPAYRQRLDQLRTEADQEAAAEREAIQAYEQEQAAAAQPTPPVTPPVTPPGAAPAVTPPVTPPGAAAPPITPAAQVAAPPPVDPTLLKALNIDPQQLAPPTPPAPPMPAAPMQQMGLPGMEAPSVPATPTPPITPPIGTQPVGGGPALPAPRLAPAGPEITEPAIEGMEPVERVTPDVVGGAEPVQPALEAAPVTEPAALPEVPRLREDATDEEIQQYAEAIRAREAAMGIKPTPVVGRLGRKVSRSRQTDEDVELQRGPVPATPVMSVPEVEAAAEETVKGWANAPTIVIAANSNDAAIPENVRSRITPDTRSAYDPNTGTVYVMADRAADKATLRGTIYHETLGHFGLRDEFNTRLDKILEDIYRTNPKVREEAEKLKAKYEDLTSNARAVQEVLAIRSEAGPIKEAGIRAAFNRLAAFIRRIGRALGFPVAYSNNDVAQILAQAHRRVTGVSPPATVKEKIKQDKKLINTPAEQVLDLGPPTPQKMSAFRKAMRQLGQSQAGVNTRRVGYELLSFWEIVDAFKTEVPALKSYENLINEKVYELKERREALKDYVLKWSQVFRKYPNLEEKFNSILLESTRLQVDFDDPADNNHSLTAEFRSLPPDLQKVYRESRNWWITKSNEYIETIVKDLPDTAANALRVQFEQRRLKVYFPLYREGPYRMRYIDKEGDTVVQAFTSPRARDLAWEIALENGAKPDSYDPDIMIDNLSLPAQTGSGFYNNVLKELDAYYDGNTPLPVKQAMYQLFLDTIPASSIRQQFRKREGYKGAERDFLKVFATVGGRMETQLNRLKYAPKLAEVKKVIDEDIAKAKREDKSEVVALEKVLGGYEEFWDDPTNPAWVNVGVFASYADFILGNISTALANLTQLPMTVYFMLAGEYGLSKAQQAMENATRLYFNGGWDNNSVRTGEKVKRSWPSDRTIFDPSKIPANSPLGRLYDRALLTNTIKHSTAQDLLEGRGQAAKLTEGFLPSLTGDNAYLGFWSKSKQILGWTFQNSERFNREVTLVAGFELAMEKGKSLGKTGKELENYAIDRAIRLTNETHGVAVTELGPRAFQGGKTMGRGVLKVSTTFKNFALTQYKLQFRLLRDGIKGMEIDTTGMSPAEKAEADALNREFRQIAIKQWLGVLTGAFTFAGVQGLPFYGAGIVLASLADAAFGDDDDPIDPEDKVKEAVGLIPFKGPMNYIIGNDVAARTGFNDMVWRDDPKRLGEIGTVLYTLEQVMGPAYGAIRRRERAIEEFNIGNLDRGLELMLPVWMANLLKTWRYYREGVLNRKGDMRVTEDLDSYQLFSQFIGFTPTEVSEAYARANARKRLELNFDKRREALIDWAYMEYVDGGVESEEFQEALEAIEKFNQSRLTAEFNAYITTRGRNNTLLRSFRERQRRARQSQDGVYFNPKKAEALKREIPE